MTKGHNQGIMKNKRSQFTVMNNIMNDIVNDKKSHNIVNNRFAHEPDSLLVILVSNNISPFWFYNISVLYLFQQILDSLSAH